MMNNEIKMPANFAAIDENEMVYLQGGATTEATAWDCLLYTSPSPRDTR